MTHPTLDSASITRQILSFRHLSRIVEYRNKESRNELGIESARLVFDSDNKIHFVRDIAALYLRLLFMTSISPKYSPGLRIATDIDLVTSTRLIFAIAEGSDLDDLTISIFLINSTCPSQIKYIAEA